VTTIVAARARRRWAGRLLCSGLRRRLAPVSAAVVSAASAWIAWAGGAHGQALALAMLAASGCAAALWLGRSLRRSAGRRRRLVRRIGDLCAERDRLAGEVRRKTRYFAAAGHELRQPLYAVAIHATALELVALRHGDASVAELSRSINAALTQSNRLLDAVLDLARLDAGIVAPRVEAISVVPLLRGLADEFGPLAALHGLTVDVELPGGALPPLATDRELLLRMLHNLVTNAIAYTQRGSVTLRARMPPGPAPERCELAVVDTGQGIAPDDQARVFDEFYRGSATPAKEGAGMGLGLSLVRQAARLLDIPVSLRSEPGRGTTVALQVPVGTGPPAEEPAAAAAAPE